MMPANVYTSKKFARMCWEKSGALKHIQVNFKAHTSKIFNRVLSAIYASREQTSSKYAHSVLLNKIIFLRNFSHL